MNKHKILDISVLVFILALGAIFFYLIRSNENLKIKLQSQELKASALIFEVGQAKDENNNLYQQMKNYEAEVNVLRETMVYVNQNSVAQNAAAPQQVNKVPRPRVDNTYVEEAAPVRNEPLTLNFLIVGHNRKLADTIILVLVKPDAKQIKLVNIPRDLVVNGRKINEYLSLYDIETLREKIELVSGLNINGYAVFSFNAFEKTIDAIAGIDIYVEKNIYDPAYPDGRGGYMVYSAQSGMNHMDGVEALKYARSRHSTSDFDRAKRQQQILVAVKEKVLSLSLLDNPLEIQKIFGAISGDFYTDVSLYDIVRYALQFKDFAVEGGNVISTANLLYSTANIKGQYILLPRKKDFSEIWAYILGLTD